MSFKIELEFSFVSFRQIFIIKWTDGNVNRIKNCVKIILISTELNIFYSVGTEKNIRKFVKHKFFKMFSIRFPLKLVSNRL